MHGNRTNHPYQSISALTGEMVQAAEAGDWDELVSLEQSCRIEIEVLKSTKGTQMDNTDSKKKAEVLKKILQDDARIRELTEPWMRNLHTILSANHKGKLVTKAYGGDESAS